MGSHRPGTPSDYGVNLALAGAAGASGCVTLVLVLSALLLGLWLDSRFDTKPLLTLGCIVGSVPISLFVMMRMVLRTAKIIQHRQYTKTGKSGDHSLF